VNFDDMAPCWRRSGPLGEQFSTLLAAEYDLFLKKPLEMLLDEAVQSGEHSLKRVLDPINLMPQEKADVGVRASITPSRSR
jgi:hypothetical protein